MKVPKAKIIKAHKLADELLAIWQADVRPWAVATKTEQERDYMTNNLHTVCHWLKQWRIEVEKGAQE